MLPLCSCKHQAMKAYWGAELYRSMQSLTLTLDGGESSVSRSGRFTPRERAPVIHWIGSWVGPRAGLVMVSKRNISTPHRKSNLRSSSP
jgi:hypothetical protein